MHSRNRFAAVAVGSIAALAGAGCNILEPGWSRSLGLVVDDPPNFSSLTAPDVVTRGTQFEITATTFGSGSCTKADGYELNASAAVAEVFVYDQTAPPGTACTEDFRSFPRTVTLQFDQAGTAEIRVSGRGHTEALKTIRKTIVVQ